MGNCIHDTYTQPELDVKLVAIDLDGTLVGSKDHISDYTIQTLRQLIAQYHNRVKFIVVTGRSFHGALPVLRQIPYSDELAICNNGAVLSEVQDYNPLIEVVLSNDKVNMLYEFCALKSVNISSTIKSGEVIFFNDLIPEFKSQQLGWEGTTQYRAYDFNHSETLLQCTLFMRSSITHEVIQFIEQTLGYNVWLYNEGEYDVIEMTAAHVNKWTMIQRYLTKLNLNPWNVVAIGNGLNDLPMIEQAGYGVAVANAVSVLKANAQEVILANVDDGVVKFLEAFLPDHVKEA